MLATIQPRSFCLLVCSLKTKIRICETIIIFVVLYGCETCPVALGQEHRLRVFENRLRRRTFGPKRNEVIGG
jgi:hypothetical protein